MSDNVPFPIVQVTLYRSIAHPSIVFYCY